LAPEHPYPCGLEDANTVYQYLIKQDIKKIGVAGDSAGAGLTLSLVARLLTGSHRLPNCCVFVSPWVDLTCRNKSFEENKENDPMLSLSQLKKTARLYTDRNLSEPLISPLHNDFQGAPPCLIQAGQNEILIDDARILAQKFKSSGIHVQFEIWEDMFHVWHYFAKYLKEGRLAIKHIGAFIKQYI
jgi:acetyl esterase/lipase